MLRFRQKTRQLVMGITAGACMSALLLGGLLIRSEWQQARAKEKLEKQYSAEIRRIEEEAKATLMKGWVPNHTIAAGQQIQEDELVSVELPKASVPVNFIASKEKIAGKTAKIELDANTLITASLLYENEVTSIDLRNREMSFVQLPLSLEKGDVVDIRIQFPTGEDYILLSKKTVKVLSKPTVAVTLNEHEILLLSSAIVDAYLHKASIYALTYVEPGLQEKAVPTYPANQQVMKLLDRDPNIVKKAENYLKTEASRDLLEKSLTSMSEQNALNFAGSQASAAVSAATSLKLDDQESQDYGAEPVQTDLGNP